MSLIDTFLNIAEGWQSVFQQERVYIRAVRQAVSGLCTHGPHTITQSICFSGRDDRDWTGEYRLHSKREWTERDIFEPALQTALELIPGSVIPVAYDDTRIKKTGKKIPTARWHYDPLSPPFRANLMWGLRYLQASVLVPFHQQDKTSPARGIPVRFTEVPHLKKPGKNASDDAWNTYKVESKKYNLSQGFVQSAMELRQALDENGAKKKHLLLVGDGSFCNQTCFRAELHNTTLLSRTRKDAKLCFRDQTPSQRYYGQEKFTPEEIRQDASINWQMASIFHGGKFRQIRYKVMDDVLWQGATRRRELKLIVVAPTPYRLTKNGRIFYRQPAYLLCTHTHLDNRTLLQSYFDRWEIEVNFRDTKSILGLGQAQLWSNASVRKQPAFVVASYANLLLAGHITFGNSRDHHYQVLPKWRRNAKRPSCLDLVNRLRLDLQTRNDVQRLFHLKFAS